MGAVRLAEPAAASMHSSSRRCLHRAKNRASTSSVEGTRSSVKVQWQKSDQAWEKSAVCAFCSTVRESQPSTP